MFPQISKPLMQGLNRMMKIRSIWLKCWEMISLLKQKRKSTKQLTDDRLWSFHLKDWIRA